MSGRRWIDPLDFADLRKQSGLTREQAAEALDVTRRTIQNWETGGARIPWMAYRMLRILRGFALPSVHWEGWTIRNDQLFSPLGRAFDAVWLMHNEHVFAQARLFRQYPLGETAEELSMEPIFTLLNPTSDPTLAMAGIQYLKIVM